MIYGYPHFRKPPVRLNMVYPLVIKRGKYPRRFKWVKNTYKWWIFDCHVWVLEGNPLEMGLYVEPEGCWADGSWPVFLMRIPKNLWNRFTDIFFVWGRGGAWGALSKSQQGEWDGLPTFCLTTRMMRNWETMSADGSDNWFDPWKTGNVFLLPQK